jgi:hypothetical protein
LDDRVHDIELRVEVVGQEVEHPPGDISVHPPFPLAADREAPGHSGAPRVKRHVA